ncbi:hypothetical protein AWM70_07540 [Paenibacillus yonginensis]|uniref:DJ-1/PfpI domain-containing protein n=1 Tax=Paenibacillus yonginensis TaxID=1462996 RepID=A0A1B1MZ46_9BACL|nr:hypothetical protein AWM70_07540 [Paenibacillus yonginensis]
MLSVQIVLFEGFDLLDAIAPYEVFSAASMMGENMINLEFVTAEGPRRVASGIDGIQLEARSKLDPHRTELMAASPQGLMSLCICWNVS